MPAECTARAGYIAASERRGPCGGERLAASGGRTVLNRNRTGTPRRNRNEFGTCAAAIRLLACPSCGAPRPRGCIRRPRKAFPAFRLRHSAYRSAAKARTWSDGLPGGACSSGCREFPHSRIAVPARRRFRCAAVGCVCPPAVSRRSGNDAPASVCVSPRRSSRSGSAPPMRNSAFAPPIFCERCAAAPNAGFLRLAQADGGMAFTGRFSDAERSLTAPPCLNARTAARFGIRRKRLGRISRAAPLRRGPNAPPQRRAETFPLLPIRRCFARLPRRPALRVRRLERPPSAVALPNAAFPYGKSCNCTDSPKNNPNKPQCCGDFRRKAGKRPYFPKTAAARRIRMQGIQRYAAKKSNAAGRRCRR